MIFDEKNLSINKAKKKHAYAITVLTRKFFPYVNFSYNTICDRLEDDKIHYIVAEYLGHTIGFTDVEFALPEHANIRFEDGTIPQGKEEIAKVLGLAVSSEFQGLGIGSKLFKEILKESKKRAGTAYVLVAEDNEKAKKLYQENEFKKIGTLDRRLGGKKIFVLKRVFA